MAPAAHFALADVSGPATDALGESETWVDLDPAYAELMATLADLGEWLDAGTAEPAFVPLCREYVDKTVVLERLLRDEFEEQWALWCARNMDLERSWL